MERRTGWGSSFQSVIGTVVKHRLLVGRRLDVKYIFKKILQTNSIFISVVKFPCFYFLLIFLYCIHKEKVNSCHKE